ncbi:MAG: undecaprenyl-diphosphate phosphatase [Candidatus Peribacteraceae bacterium]|nr:undecaprenyl-diphosphate phosphatase [Candidatus Peribacteraceae bacterium]MDD5739972.1 undecaprenyl-diphosphate phosphatase [Candidatus Peribacteraceae bacterium]
MTTMQALFLGLLQGCTELLPISSSGHLALAEQFLAVRIPQGLLGFDVLLHFGSLLALLLCYHKTWIRILRSPFIADRAGMRMFALLIIVTIPAGLAGIFFGEALDGLRSLPMLAAGFLVSAIVLLVAERVPVRRPFTSLKIWEVLCIGVAQACALLPSVSRSGMTIAACRALKLRRSDAVDFAFLMAVPAIAGATLFTAINVMKGTMTLPSLAVSSVGFLASFGASIFAILLLRAFVQRFSTAWFALYLIPLAVLLLTFAR